MVFPKYIAINFSFFYLSPDRFVFILLLLFLLYTLITSKKLKKTFFNNIRENKVIIIFLLLFLFIQLLAALNSNDVAYSFKQYLLKVLYTLVIFLFLFGLPLTDNLEKKIKITFTLSIIIILITGYIEYLQNQNIYLNYVNWSTLSSSQKSMFTDQMRGGYRRIQASFEHTLNLGQYLILTIPFVFYLNKKNKKTAFVIFLAAIPIVFLTRSRAAFVLILLISIYIVIFRNIKINKVYFIYFAIIGFITLAIWYSQIINSFNELYSFLFGNKLELITDNAREIQWHMAIPLIYSNPFLGYGLGMGSDILGFGRLGATSIDNYFLTLILDSGVISAVIFVLFILSFLKKYPSYGSDLFAIYLGLLLFVFNLFTLSLWEVHPIFYFILSFYLIKKNNLDYEK